jgi:bifunctional non-homologous end joining protein LigD
MASGWEGLIAKQVNSRYQSGKRTPDWRKLKIVQEQEFVVGGWTEPRNARAHFGALLLGVYEGRALVYVGHTGTGFGGRELARLMKLLRPIETTTCPFKIRPKSNERAHWVEPRLIAQVKFTEWTADAKLRHPVYLGLRDDKRANDVHRETATRLPASASLRRGPEAATPAARLSAAAASKPLTARGRAARATASKRRTRAAAETRPARRESNLQLIEQLKIMEEAHQDGVLELGGGQRLSVTNLHKLFWPKPKLTKGDLFRYYVQVAPFLLPAIADRPLVMKRFPNGVAGKPFYQHRAAEVPAGVRVESVPAPGEGTGARSHIVGGQLLTLLYTTQLAAISQDPWFSRAESPADADYAALDLDPSPGVGFQQVLDVARWIRDELASIGAIGVPKTSGADGLHVYIPLPAGTPYEAGMLFCQIVATVVANKHPREATIERSIRARGKRVYVDFLQNSPGKTLASAYSARASEIAGVSTPLTWEEVDHGVSREDFTLTTVPARLAEVGDLWAVLRRSKGVDLSRAGRFK